MIFGDRKYFTKEHFEQNKGYAPAYLCELVVYCLELLSHLSHHQLKFRFKGGTSLLLLLDKPYRFSLDIDIDTVMEKDDLSAVMAEIVEDCELFKRLEVRPHKTKPWLPMISYNIFFDSCYQKPEDSFLMLDAVLKESPTEGFQKQIAVGDLYKSDQFVELTRPSGLLSDKLLTLCPATLGIPIGKGKAAQRLKHVFDSARLIETGVEADAVARNIEKCIDQENQIQQSQHQLPEIIDDTLAFLQAAAPFDDLPDPATIEEGGAKEGGTDAYLYEIVTGFEEFRQYVFNMQYTWAKLKNDMEKVIALVSAL